jgi:hypothetical protein
MLPLTLPLMLPPMLPLPPLLPLPLSRFLLPKPHSHFCLCYHPKPAPPPIQLQQAMSTRQPASSRESQTPSYRNPTRGQAHLTRSRSRSPIRNTAGRLPPRSSSPNRQRPRQESKRTTQDRQPFQSSAASTGLHACALCLGRFAHNVHKCKSEFLWDNRTPTSCRRSTEGRLINSQGLQLCYDWQRPNGCASTSKDHIHECSGCGNLDHGAQSCPRGQEAQGSHPLPR